MQANTWLDPIARSAQDRAGACDNTRSPPAQRSGVGMILVQDLSKHYKVHRRPPGLRAAFRSVFRRKYTTVKAVDGITFEIRPGERVGFLGPNGAEIGRAHV